MGQQGVAGQPQLGTVGQAQLPHPPQRAHGSTQQQGIQQQVAKQSAGILIEWDDVVIERSLSSNEKRNGSASA